MLPEPVGGSALMDNIQFLSHDQVCELTDAKLKARQTEIRKRNGIPHTIKASGWPYVITANLLPHMKKRAEPSS